MHTTTEVITYEVSREAAVTIPGSDEHITVFQRGTAIVRATPPGGKAVYWILPDGSALNARTDDELIQMAKPELHRLLGFAVRDRRSGIARRWSDRPPTA